MYFIIIIATILILALYFLFWEEFFHSSRVNSITHRIHVNGIRGKSSVTRLLGGILREANINTISKTTGSDANVIPYHGNDVKIQRKGPANVYENVRITKEYVSEKTDAIVYECMAIQPRFQKFLEERVMRTTIGIITNIREDHMEELGFTLEQIAESLSVTIPYNGYLISSEDNPKLQEILKKNAEAKGSRYINALKYSVDKKKLAEMDYIEHEENISIALALADILNIDEELAWKGIYNVNPDPGALTIDSFRIEDREIIWCNLFAVNDRQSYIKIVNKIRSTYSDENTSLVLMLNNRKDRADRAELFKNIVNDDINADMVVTVGELEEQIAPYMKNQNKYLPLAKYQNKTGEELMKEIIDNSDTKKVIIIGSVNIHSHQAESMMEYFDEIDEEESLVEYLNTTGNTNGVNLAKSIRKNLSAA